MKKFVCFLFGVCFLTAVQAQEKMTAHGLIVDSLEQMLQQNRDVNLSICEADPNTMQCIGDVEFPVYSYALNTMMKVPSVQVLSSKIWADKMGLSLILGYTVKMNNIYPSCQTVSSAMTVSPDTVMNLSSLNMKCQVTQAMQANVSMNFQIDYIDFNDGVIGAYYTIQSNGSFIGKKAGFATIKFQRPLPNFFMPPFLTEQRFTPEQVAEIKAFMPEDNAMTKVVTVYKTVYVDGKEVYTEKDKREFVQDEIDKPLVENIEAKEFTTSGTMPMRPKKDLPVEQPLTPKAQEYIKNLELPDSIQQ